VQAAHPRRPRANAAATARIGIRRSSTRPRGGDVDARHFAREHAQIGHVLAAFGTPVENLDPRAHLEQVVISPIRSGFIITPSTTTSEPGVISAATIGNAAEDGSAARRRAAAVVPGDRPASPPTLALALDADLGAEMGEHLLRMVARRLRSTTSSSRARSDPRAGRRT